MEGIFCQFIQLFSFQADPYIVIKCGKNKLVDQENYKPNTLNPVFGRWVTFWEYRHLWI